MECLEPWIYRQIICETDCREAFEVIQLGDNGSYRAHLHQDVVQEIVVSLMLQNRQVEFQVIMREANGVAHTLASWGSSAPPMTTNFWLKASIRVLALLELNIVSL